MCKNVHIKLNMNVKCTVFIVISFWNCDVILRDWTESFRNTFLIAVKTISLADTQLLCVFRAFVIVYDLIILVNAVFIGLDEKNTLIANSEWAFLSLYLLEILLKLYVFEPRAFFSKHSFWNWWETASLPLSDTHLHKVGWKWVKDSG